MRALNEIVAANGAAHTAALMRRTDQGADPHIRPLPSASLAVELEVTRDNARNIVTARVYGVIGRRIEPDPIAEYRIRTIEMASIDSLVAMIPDRHTMIRVEVPSHAIRPASMTYLRAVRAAVALLGFAGYVTPEEVAR